MSNLANVQNNFSNVSVGDMFSTDNAWDTLRPASYICYSEGNAGRSGIACHRKTTKTPAPPREKNLVNTSADWPWGDKLRVLWDVSCRRIYIAWDSNGDNQYPTIDGGTFGICFSERNIGFARNNRHRPWLCWNRDDFSAANDNEQFRHLYNRHNLYFASGYRYYHKQCSDPLYIGQGRRNLGNGMAVSIRKHSIRNNGFIYGKYNRNNVVRIIDTKPFRIGFAGNRSGLFAMVQHSGESGVNTCKRLHFFSTDFRAYDGISFLRRKIKLFNACRSTNNNIGHNFYELQKNFQTKGDK